MAAIATTANASLISKSSTSFRAQPTRSSNADCSDWGGRKEVGGLRMGGVPKDNRARLDTASFSLRTPHQRERRCTIRDRA